MNRRRKSQPHERVLAALARIEQLQVRLIKTARSLEKARRELKSANRALMKFAGAPDLTPPGKLSGCCVESKVCGALDRDPTETGPCQLLPGHAGVHEDHRGYVFNFGAPGTAAGLEIVPEEPAIAPELAAPFRRSVDAVRMKRPELDGLDERPNEDLDEVFSPPPSPPRRPGNGGRQAL